MPVPRILRDGLAIGEAPRWHEGRPWFCNWGTQEVLAVDLEGNSEVMARCKAAGVRTRKEAKVDWTMEVVTIPVSDVERARDFYARKVGFEVDIDMVVDGGIRLVQLTPPGSSCSIHLGTSTVDMEPGSLDGLILVVRDVRAARSQLAERGVEVGELQVFDAGSFRPAREEESLDYAGCVFFRDPDGNRWCVQQIPDRG